MMNTEEIINSEQEYMLQTYARLPLAIVRGEGCTVYDPEGNAYLDGVAGIAVNLLGYHYQPVIDAVCEQAGELIHASNLYYTVPQVELAKKLVNRSGFSKVFFNNSGAEANEVALKMARFYGRRKYGNRYKFISLSRSFHGRTFMTLAVTAQEKFHHDLEPLASGVRYADLNDLASLCQVLDDEVCGIIVEPVQGEGGVYPAEKEFLEAVRALCDEKDLILIFDEVQCGMGRTGRFFAFETYGVKPDVITLAKGLGGGFPIGAIIVGEKIVSITKKGDQGSTFGGNPVCAKAAGVMVDAVSQPELLAMVRERGEYLKKELHLLRQEFPGVVTDFRGLGLMWGIDIPGKAKKCVELMLHQGILVNAANDDTIRLLPPLIIKESELALIMNGFRKVLPALKMPGIG
ncbi:MAG: aspartate aminotransferase family protein [Candidatus Atribacteria bacterium]|nr:aspartate aminotransferase family protein [Candidatus Atribacteria bacterium]